MRGVSTISDNSGPGGTVCPIQSGKFKPGQISRESSRQQFPWKGGNFAAPSKTHIVTRGAGLAPYPSLDAWMTPGKIIHLLARFRLGLAADRSEANQWNHLFPSAMKDPENKLPPIYPPRNEWHAFRPKWRRDLDAADVWARALEYRMLFAIQNNETHPWARALQQEIESIRECALGQAGFSFSPPRVHAAADEFDPKKIRIISTFGFRDRVVLSLVSQYLSSLVDPFLSDASVAFRRDRNRNAPAALRELQELNISRGKSPLIVGEYDIRSCFDALSHEVIGDSVRLIAERLADTGVGIDPRALELVRAYLACYSFPKSVLPVLPVASKKWPLEALQEFYAAPLDEPLGIPQGGALSNILVNIVLDRVDRALANFRHESGKSVAYWRYCDDSLIIARDQEICSGAFAAYLHALHSLRLPVHSPVSCADNDMKLFMSAKSRAPYPWAEKKIPWIGFLGFQFRYDGLARLRPSTVKKVHFKMSKMARRLQWLAKKQTDAGNVNTLPSADRIRRFLLNKTMA